MVSASQACRICSGGLELLYPGAAGGPTAQAFSPTNHAPGAFADLWRCVDCGTVHQPSLPAGDALHDLYRAMGDDAYLAEEAGRRATARRVLDLVGAHVAAATHAGHVNGRRRPRLLDVGCGHGLLLDEARLYGYATLGLELSARAAGHARARLGLDVLEQPLAEFRAPDGRGFDVIVLADVIEHVDDPVGAIGACARLLAEGGVLVVVTPDPSSATARLAGRRWWGYLPAHACLLPRRTLRELLAARGLVISTDVALVRTFSLRYWLAGAGERGGVAGAAVRALARLPAADRPLSLSLGDERVILAHNVAVRAAPMPLFGDRGHATSVHVVLPAYNAARTVAHVAAALPADAADRALLVDDHSPDATAEEALAAGLDVLRHPANRGYGGNQKSCYVRAALDGADIVVMVHADNQYDPGLVARMAAPIERGRADVVIGSRLLEDAAIAGGMPRWKWLGNRLLTTLENLAFRRSYSEYHTGYRAFSTDFLRSVAFLRNSDGFVFDQEIFAQAVARDARIVELPIPTRYFLEASSVSFRASVDYGLRTLWVLIRFRLDERRGRWPLLRPPAAVLERPARAASAPAR